jgi:hypothetical protein
LSILFVGEINHMLALVIIIKNKPPITDPSKTLNGAKNTDRQASEAQIKGGSQSR